MLPLATRALRLVPSGLGDDAGVLGAAAMTIDRVMSPTAVDELVSSAESSGLIKKIRPSLSERQCHH